MLTFFATLQVGVPENIKASQSVFGVAREVAALTGVASAPFPSTSEVPVVSFEQRTLLDEVELERMEEPGGGNDPEMLRSGAVSECMLYRGEYV